MRASLAMTVRGAAVVVCFADTPGVIGAACFGAVDYKRRCGLERGALLRDAGVRVAERRQQVDERQRERQCSPEVDKPIHKHRSK